MKKKLYILTCMNEEGKIVTIVPYLTRDEARKNMKEQYEAERRDAIASGWEPDDYYTGLEADSAGIQYGESEYKWQIHEVDCPEVKDELSDTLKEQFLEQVYFELCEDVDSGAACTLDTEVEGYDGFFLDTNRKTIFVHIKGKSVHHDIFKMAKATAYQIAKAIHRGDYKVC